MIWDDVGFLLSKNKYNENSIIAEIFTEEHGKISGIIFGATSKKIKNYLEIGNKLHVNYTYKNEGKIGYFKVEILQALTPLYFDNKNKLLCLSSAISLIKLLTVEAQKNLDVFKLTGNIFYILSKKNWIMRYIFWELDFLRVIGYDLELKKMTENETIDNKIKYFVKNKSIKKYIPSFLIEDTHDEFSKDELLKGLNLVGDYLEKSILKPNNINPPISRLSFINIFK